MIRPSPTVITLPKIPQCSDVINACDRALEAKNKEIKEDKMVIDKSLEDNSQLQQEVKEKDEKLNSIWRNPFFMLLLGLVGGVLIHR